MYDNPLFWSLLVILIAEWGFSLILNLLNRKNSRKPLPPEVEGIYDREKYGKWLSYFMINQRMSSVRGGISTLLYLVIIGLGGFSYLNEWAASWSQLPIVQALIFFGVIHYVSDVLFLPFSIYDTFGIEAKYGFNKTTPKTFVMDTLRGWLLTAIMGGGILAVITWFYLQTGAYFWFWAWGFIAFFSIFMAEFYSVLIVPLFNKQRPLEEGELRSAIVAFTRKISFPLDNIFVIDGSKRSTKANAYFTGLGKRKRIVLYDTLVNTMATDEIVAVLAHEIGHFKKKHVQKRLITSILQLGVVLFFFSWVVSSPLLSEALGVSVPNFHVGLLAFSLLYSPISTVLNIFLARFSRKDERQADAFAAHHAYAEDLISALKKLSATNLSNLNPHPAVVSMTYSHPPVGERIKQLRATTPKQDS